MFRIIIFFPLICRMIECILVALRTSPRNLLFRFATEQIQHPDGVCSAVYFWGAARTTRLAPNNSFCPAW
jgi:hypothetical protein